MIKNKNKISDMIVLVFTVLVSIFIGMIVGGLAMYTSPHYEENSKLKDIEDTYNMILSEYYGSIDENDLSDAAIKGMTSVLDAYTEYYKEGEAISFNNQVNGEYYGLGISASTVDNGILVVTVLDDSPAKEAGIEAGDIITSLNGKSLEGVTAEEFTSMIAKADPENVFTILRDNKTKDYKITLKRITIKSVSGINFNGVGYIKIDIFAANSALQFRSELEKLEKDGIKSLIIDVRDNSGGYLHQVSEILEMFIKKGNAIYGIDDKKNIQMTYDNTDEMRNYNVVVLINGNSASASEILAAGLKESYGAKLVGLTTFGKGTAQETSTLSNGTMLKITTKKWLTPNGTCINNIGVEPDYKIALDYNVYDINDYNTDSQLQKAIEIINK